MEICVKDSLKIVEIWLTNADQRGMSPRESFRMLFEEYKLMKFNVAVFNSGRGDLFDSTAGLLLFNRK